MIDRRKFLCGLIAAPAIVHAGNLMPIRMIEWSEDSMVELARITREVFLPRLHQHILDSKVFKQWEFLLDLGDEFSGDFRFLAES